MKNPYKKLQYYSYIPSRDAEGNKISQKTEDRYFVGYAYPVTDKIQVELYGDRINSILNILTKDVACKLKRRDIVMIDEDEYKVISKKPYTDHIVYEVELV